MPPADLRALADRVERLTGPANNTLDVEIEVALYRPGSVYSAVRANAAGTKVIYTDKAGNSVTCWADEWTGLVRRAATAAALRARADMGDAM